MILSLFYRGERLFCAGCHRIIWRWQDRCGWYHKVCKHADDDRLADLNGIARWTCAWCKA